MLALSMMMMVGALAQQAEPTSHLLVVSGLGGEEQYENAFYEAGKRIAAEARSTYRLPANRVIFLAEAPERDTKNISGPSTKDEIERAFQAIAKAAKPGDLVFVVLIGHGSAQDDDVSQFNIPGPDMTAADFGKLLVPLAEQRVAFVNTTSASGDFVDALAGKGRIVITATVSPLERNYTKFSQYFAEALAGRAADQNEDGRVSLLEAFRHTTENVERAYKSAGLLQSEHAMLDDNGDGEGSRTPGLQSADGRIAAQWTLTGIVPEDPRIAALLAEHDALIKAYEGLLVRKPTMDAAAYGAELERLLTDLVLLSLKVRQVGMEDEGKP